MTRFWIVLSAAVALVGCASMAPPGANDTPGAPA